MKKIYLLSSAVLLSVASYAQVGHAFIKGTKPSFYKASAGERATFPDTTGIGSEASADFNPVFGSTGEPNLIFSYTGGGYVYGNNKDGLNKCAQGYDNFNDLSVKVTDVILFFVAKKSDLGSSPTSKVKVQLYDMADNRAFNQKDGAFNQTVLNFEGPVATPKGGSADILYADIDTTTAVGFNVVSISPAAQFAHDFAISVDFSGLVLGDTAGLLCDAIHAAFNLDFAYHYIGGKWYCTDNAFSASGSDDVDNDIALFAILSDATGVNEYFNGMKLTTYPNPTVDKATIEYTLEKNSNGVALVVYDAAGHKVVDNSYNQQAAGTYKVDVDATNLKGGTYYYQLFANGHNFSKKFIVTK